ncbi:MAG: multiheme c-type cytochrome, partial [Candidatus Zophobacter franzmannii]|nr:multiheme c-type cytochrome [Candidatus Zophobacter franzmannii]
PYVIVELSNGFRCGITGIVDDQVTPGAVGPGLEVLSPAEALANVLPEMQSKVDYLVLLAFTDEPEMKALAQQFFELDLIVGGQVQKGSAEAVIENRSAIVFNTDKGKAVGRLDLTWGADQSWTYQNRFKTLEESMIPDTRFVDLTEQFKAQLKAQDFRPVRDDVDGLSSIAAGRKTEGMYVGPDTCKTCHPTAYAVWSKSKHAHAFAILEAKGHQYNPRCLICHTVGYMESDGYINERLTPNLVNVSCESCHGRGDVHVKARTNALDSEQGMTTQTPDCTGCHDEENSPDFDKASYLREIVHGKESTNSTD